ncbi:MULTISPECIES: DUF3194 domain-containing protein [Halorussus]|uniref:DUF3194 domain-containing protein n=1 Tax=Halorussus TaxID=1070314 RepID=UPI0020A1003E|nr:DUF3194 domain-containing protein [Halorussus vallis]USZ74900.1 DUF3194 domain-containing protein [Halorussus vallis]
MSGDDATESEPTPSDDEVVRTAAEAAEGLIFSRFKQSTVKDVDVTVTFEDGVLDVDVYLNVPDEQAKAEKVAEDAALAARSAVDDLFAEAEA